MKLKGFAAFFLICRLVAASDSLLPIPDAAAQAKAENTIHELYAKELANPTAANRRQLARKFLQQAIDTHDDATAQYVLLRQAKELSTELGDAALASRAIRETARNFQINSISTLLAAMQATLANIFTPASCESFTRTCLKASEQAVLSDDYGAATRFISLAETAAERARNVGLVSTCRTKAKELQATFMDYTRAKAARETLKSQPDDSDANFHAGRVALFIKADWEAGLRMLAKGFEPNLRRLAADDLADPKEAENQLKLANAWWDLAQTQIGLAKFHLQQRAGHWYSKALADLSGINRTLAESRLEIIDVETLRDMNLERGVAAELYRGVSFANFARARIDSQINFDWGLDAPDPALPKDNFSLRWTGVLKPTIAGHYDLVVIANAGARVWLDEKLIVDEPNLYRRRNGVRHPIDLSAEIHPIKIEYWDTTGAAKMRVLWQAPGMAKEEPIPATAWYHDVTLSQGETP